jgi:type IV secretory pathway VirB2 component (pilin)
MAAVLRQFVFTVALASWAANTEAQGLSRARSTLQNFQSELMLFVPIIAVVSLIILAILWGLRVIHFRTLAQWGGGVLLVGAASQLVNMLLS